MYHAETTGVSPANKGRGPYVFAAVILILFVLLSFYFSFQAMFLPYDDPGLLGNIPKDLATYTTDRSHFLSYWTLPLLGLFVSLLYIAMTLPRPTVVVMLTLMIGSIDGCTTFSLFNPPQTQSSFLFRRAIGSIESTRAALASYAADTPGNSYPARIASWEDLVKVVNSNGATLKNTAAAQGFALRGYTAIDNDGDAIFEDYTMSFLVDGLPDTRSGRLVLVSPNGIEKDIPSDRVHDSPGHLASRVGQKQD